MKEGRLKKLIFIFGAFAVGLGAILLTASDNTGAFLSGSIDQWHEFLELVSIIFSGCIAVIAYYVFYRTNRLYTFCVFLLYISLVIIGFLHMNTFEIPAISKLGYSLSNDYSFLFSLILSTGLLGLCFVPPDYELKQKPLKKYSIIAVASVAWFTALWFLNQLIISFRVTMFLNLYSQYLVIVLLLVTLSITAVKVTREEKYSSHYIEFIALLLFVSSEIVFVNSGEKRLLLYFLSHICRCAALMLMFGVLFKESVRRPYEELRGVTEKLSRYAERLELMVEERTREIKNTNDNLNRNMEEARKIQASMLTTTFPYFRNVSFHALYKPCEKIGGDFYDVRKLDDENVGILIGDVSGHGISAALVNVFINLKLDLFKNYPSHHKIYAPNHVLERLFYDYNKMQFPEEMYAVMFYGILNTKTLKLVYSSAGMNVPPIVLSSYGKVSEIEVEGFPICSFGDYVKPAYENSEIQLHSGDRLILYTDGLVEIGRKNSGTDISFLSEQLTGGGGGNCESICNHILNAYNIMLKGKDRPDDMTVLVAAID